MGNITFVEHDGKQHEVELEVGKSLMQIAMDNGISGIDADCGGACACGTCHVIVDSQWIKAAGSINPDELQMLEMTPKKHQLRVFLAKLKLPMQWMVWSYICQNFKCDAKSINITSSYLIKVIEKMSR